MAALREMLGTENTTLTWVDTTVQLADVLTKLEAEGEFILQVMSSGTVSILPNAQAIKSKEYIRAGRHRRHAEAKAKKEAEIEDVEDS